MQALIDHSLSAAPVWCSRLQCYTQLLTTDLCLRLLAQAFPLDTAPSSSPSANGNGEDDSAVKKDSDPSVSMNYWEGKTMGSVLSTVNRNDCFIYFSSVVNIFRFRFCRNIFQLGACGVSTRSRS